MLLARTEDAGEEAREFRGTATRSWGCSTSVSASPLASRFGDEVASVDVDDAGTNGGLYTA